jgi:hypothetical protein
MSWANITDKWNAKAVGAGGKRSVKWTTTVASAASTRVYEGSLIVLKADGTGKLGGSSFTAADVFAGVATGNYTWDAAEANLYVEVWTKGEFEFYHASAAQTDVGTNVEPGVDATYGPVSVADKGTTANSTAIGTVTGLGTGSNRLRVSIDGFAMNATNGIAS